MAVESVTCAPYSEYAGALGWAVYTVDAWNLGIGVISRASRYRPVRVSSLVRAVPPALVMPR